MLTVTVQKIFFIISAFIVLTTYGQSTTPPCCPSQKMNGKECSKGSMHKGKHHGGHHGGMWNNLDLTEDQKSQLTLLNKEHRPLMQKNREEMKTLRLQLKEVLLRDDVREDDVTEISNKIAEINKAISNEMALHMLKVKDILTKEQFARVANKFDHQGMMGKGHCKDGNGMPGSLHCDQKCDESKECKHKKDCDK